MEMKVDIVKYLIKNEKLIILKDKDGKINRKRYNLKSAAWVNPCGTYNRCQRITFALPA